MSCGGGADSAVTTDETADLNARDCLVEMNTALQSVLGNENNASWSAKQWTQELAKASSSLLNDLMNFSLFTLRAAGRRCLAVFVVSRLLLEESSGVGKAL